MVCQNNNTSYQSLVIFLKNSLLVPTNSKALVCELTIDVWPTLARLVKSDYSVECLGKSYFTGQACNLN